MAFFREYLIICNNSIRKSIQLWCHFLNGPKYPYINKSKFKKYSNNMDQLHISDTLTLGHI